MQHRVPVVVCDECVSDGDWKVLMEQMHGLEFPPNLIVIAAQPGDNLWAETFNWGAYDLLSAPYSPAEIYRLVSLACDAKCREWSGAAAPKKPVASYPAVAGASRAASQQA